jgi:hypothetical protein
LTHFDGVYFFHEFLRVLQLRHFLAQQLSYPRRNGRYSVPQMILALVYPIILGLDRIETASFLFKKWGQDDNSSSGNVCDDTNRFAFQPPLSSMATPV